MMHTLTHQQPLPLATGKDVRRRSLHMKTALLGFTLALSALAAAEPPKTIQQELREELKEIQRDLQTLTQRERELAVRLKELEAGRDTTKGVSNICPVHKTEMRIVRAPIYYGLHGYAPRDSSLSVRHREFPFALNYWLGGCVVGDYTEAKIYICPDCQRAEKQWRKKHSK